jgi:hypothetical protein
MLHDGVSHDVTRAKPTSSRRWPKASCAEGGITCWLTDPEQAALPLWRPAKLHGGPTSQFGN